MKSLKALTGKYEDTEIRLRFHSFISFQLAALQDAPRRGSYWMMGGAAVHHPGAGKFVDDPNRLAPCHRDAMRRVSCVSTTCREPCRNSKGGINRHIRALAAWHGVTNDHAVNQLPWTHGNALSAGEEKKCARSAQRIAYSPATLQTILEGAI
jgi:hypothetical protein